MRTLLTLFVAGSLLSNAVAADPVRIRGRIVDEAGEAISGATVQVRNSSYAVNADGEFAFDFDSPTTVSVRVEAPGYYTFIHTLHRSDFVPGREAEVSAIELVQKKPGRTLTLFAGDTMLSRRYFEPRDGEPIVIRRHSILGDGKKLLQHVRPYVELADYASVNLETQLSATELENPLPKSVVFYSPVELADLVEWAGFDYVALGNNHMFDYRDDGLRSTIEALDKTDLDFSGAGLNAIEAQQAARVTIDGQPFAFFSYVGWPGTFEPNQVAEHSKGGATLADTDVIATSLGALPGNSVAVLQLHAGLEYSANPALTERTALREAVINGADIAIGHHPHVLQGFEIANDRLIAYSLGNFLFDQYHYATQLGMLLFVWMDGDKLHRAEAVPLHINGYVPTPATGLVRHAILTRLARLSHASVCMRASGFHAVIERCRGDAQAPDEVVAPISATDVPMHVRTLGASPLMPLMIESEDRPYRLGLDILNRGDFEYARLYGAHDRTWIVSGDASLKTGDNNRLEIRVPAGGEMVRTGMKVFERVFTLSNPATVSGRIQVQGDVRIRILLQRRREADALEDALASGPSTEIARKDYSSADWREFTFDYNQPRIATRSVRLLLEIEDLSVAKEGATVSLDDLAWIEWQTPWIREGDRHRSAIYATHLQLQVTPKP